MSYSRSITPDTIKRIIIKIKTAPKNSTSVRVATSLWKNKEIISRYICLIKKASGFAAERQIRSKHDLRHAAAKVIIR